MLVRLDDGDYRLALDQAKSKLATQKAQIVTFDAQIKAAEAAAAQARAQLDSAKATVVKTEADYTRTNALTAKDYSTKASLDAAIAARDSARAQVKADEAGIQSADANISLLHAQREQAVQVAKELQVAVDQAERDLSFTVIRAPFDGVIGNKSVQVGDYVTPGKRLAASCRSTRFMSMPTSRKRSSRPHRRGQTVKVAVDALDGEMLEGHGRQRRARVGLAILAAAARERDRQFHKDRAARAGAHRGPASEAEGPAASGLVGRRRHRHAHDAQDDTDQQQAAKYEFAIASLEAMSHEQTRKRPRDSTASIRRAAGHARVDRRRRRASSRASWRWCSACSWRSWTSRSSRPRYRRFRPGFPPARTKSRGSRPAI